MDSGISKRFIIIISIICISLVILVIIGFSIFNNRKPMVVEENLHGAKIILNYTSDNGGFKASKLMPTTDAAGMIDLTEGNYLDFSIEVKLDNASSVKYEIAAVKDTINSTVVNDDIRIYLEKENSGTYSKVFGPDKFLPLTKESELGSPKGSMVLVKAKKTNSKPDNYRLRIWASDKSLVQNGTYSIQLKVNGKAY